MEAARRDLLQMSTRKRYAKDRLNVARPPRGSYAFVYRHVRKAKTEANLLRLALTEPNLGLESTKVNTREIYGDQALLMAALSLAERA